MSYRKADLIKIFSPEIDFSCKIQVIDKMCYERRYFLMK